MTNWPTDKPDADVAEVSIFGPGKGESCVVHLGAGKWIVVDSCIDQRSGVNPALDYLNGLGVDLESDVLLVVGTHAHSDHIAGISSIYAACRSAFFVMPQALSSNEFLTLVAADAKTTTEARGGTAYSEYRRIFEVAKARKRSDGLRPIKYAAPNRPLLQPSQLKATVTSLSPSDAAFEKAVRYFSRESPSTSTSRRSPFMDPNECAIALWVETPSVAVLLGADVLKGPAGCGWQAILGGFAPGRAASLIKVPHHGAPNAHEPQVWSRLLTSAPVAGIAPFRGGNEPRPSTEDRERIISLTPNAYATASTRVPKQSRSTQRQLVELGGLPQAVRDPWGSCGQIRARHAGGDDWRVDLYGPARPLSVIEV